MIKHFNLMKVRGWDLKITFMLTLALHNLFQSIIFKQNLNKLLVIT